MWSKILHSFDLDHQTGVDNLAFSIVCYPELPTGFPQLELTVSPGIYFSFISVVFTDALYSKSKAEKFSAIREFSLSHKLSLLVVDGPLYLLFP